MRNITNDSDELTRLLSDRVERVMDSYFPNAKQKGDVWAMGNLDGDTGTSTAVWRGRSGIYLAKDHADNTPTLSILALLHRALGGSWADTFIEARRICGRQKQRLLDPVYVPRKRKGIPTPSKVAAKPPTPKRIEVCVTEDMFALEYFHFERCLDLDTLLKYEVGLVSKNEWAVPFYDSEGSYVMMKATAITRDENGKKKIWSTAPYSTLWGWQTLEETTRSICINEGEIEAMSMSQLVDIPCLSLPSGTSNLGWIDNDAKALAKLETIYVVMDNDDAGEKAAAAIIEKLGNKCVRIRVPEPWGDVNEYIAGDRNAKFNLSA